MMTTDKKRTVKVGVFGVALGAWSIGVSVYGFLTDQAEILFGTRFWVWVSRSADPSLYWISNTTFLVLGALVVAGSATIVWKALRDPTFPLPRGAGRR